MQVRPVSTQPSQPSFSPSPSAPPVDQSLYHSRIVFEKQSKPVELFWKGWGFCKNIVLTIWDYIVWFARCCPSMPSKIDVVQEMIDNPKDKAKECVKAPAEHLAAFFQAALIDPEGLDELRKEDGYGEFLRALNVERLNDNVFTGVKEGALKALKALANPFGSKDSSDLFKSFLGILKDNVPLLAEALLNTCDKVEKALGSADSENEKFKALKALFGTYLRKVAEEAKVNPKALKPFIEEFYQLKQLDESVIPLMKKHFPEKAKPSADDEKNLKLCLKEKCLTLSQLGKDDLAGSAIGADTHVDIGMAFYQGLIEVATPETIEKFIPLIEADYPLMAAFGKALKELANDRSSLKRASENLPQAIELLKKIREELKNPPTPKKEEKK